MKRIIITAVGYVLHTMHVWLPVAVVAAAAAIIFA